MLTRFIFVAATLALSSAAFADDLIGQAWVKSVDLTFRPSLPIYPDQRTSSDQPGWSG